MAKAIRRPQRFDDLVAVTGTTEERLRAILEAFRKPGVSFITPYPPKLIDAETVVDVSHEALIRRWRKIADPQQGWLQQEIKDGLMWRALLVEAESHKRNPKSLLSEAATEERSKWLGGRNEAWARRYEGDWPAVAALLEASRREVEDQHMREKEQRQRELREQERRTRDAEALAAANLRTARWRTLGLVVALVFATVAVVFAILAWQQTTNAHLKASIADREQARAESHLETTIGVVQGLLAQLPKLRDQGIHADQLKDILARVVEVDEKLRAASGDNGEVLQMSSNSLRETSKTLVTLGDNRGAHERASKASDIAQKLAKAAPDDDRWAQELWESHNQIGDVLVEQREVKQALRSYKEGLEIAKARAGKDPSRADWQLNLVISEGTIGEILVSQGKLDEAFTYLKPALKIAKEHAVKDQSETDLKYDRWRLEIDYYIGIGLASQNKVDEALSSFEEALAIAKDRAHTDLDNPEWQLIALKTNLVISTMEQVPRGIPARDDAKELEKRLTLRASESLSDTKLQDDLASIKNNLGNRLLAEAKFDDAARYYALARDGRKRLAEKDRSNMRWQRNLPTSIDTIGDLLVEQGRLDKALGYYEEGRAIRQRLADKDLSNTELQRDLWRSHDNIGGVLVKLGKLDDALVHFKEGLTIRRALAVKDTLAMTDERIGYILFRWSKSKQALAFYKKGHAIRQALAETDKANVEWQRDLASSHDSIAAVLVKQNKLDDALASFKDSLTIRQALAAKEPSNTDLQRDLELADDSIAAVLVEQNKLDSALQVYNASLAIAMALAEKDRANVEWQRDLASSHDNIGDVLVKQNKLDDALASFKDSLTIRQALVEKNKFNEEWQSDLRISVDYIGSIADKFDKAGAFSQALAAADLAISLAPDDTWLYANRAHALMFLDRVDEARAIYLQHRGAQTAGMLWEQAILKDFDELSKKGFKRPLMDEIQTLFQKPADISASGAPELTHPKHGRSH
jgi:tetratricopeptide (TPR) repeat protein